MKSLLAYCERELAWAVETTEALVRLESPTPDKAAVDRCGEELARRLGDIGGRVQRFPRAAAGDHLLAEFGCGPRQVLVLGHLDTVWDVGTLSSRPLRHEDGLLYGPGVFDMKAGLALGMLALRALADSASPWPGRVTMLVTSDEETGSATSRSLIEDEALRSEAVLVLEPSLPGGALKTSRKGCGAFTVRVEGVAAHAGIEPEKGASAIHELARQILAIERLQDPGRGTTLSVGTVRGGTRANVIAAEAEAVVDVRVAESREAARITSAMLSLVTADPRTRLTVGGGVDRPPFERTPAVADLSRQAHALAAEIGVDLGEGSTGGGSDGNLTAAVGVPTLDGLGAVGGGAHAIDEHVRIADLPWRAALLAGLLRRILEI
ncbi:MAG: M20 family metallopeptidase [Acidobacteria bacterium]|nr:M20 family metallopeptidase [Acidobacteriota bacterium]